MRRGVRALWPEKTERSSQPYIRCTLPGGTLSTPHQTWHGHKESVSSTLFCPCFILPAWPPGLLPLCDQQDNSADSAHSGKQEDRVNLIYLFMWIENSFKSIYNENFLKQGKGACKFITKIGLQKLVLICQIGLQTSLLQLSGWCFQCPWKKSCNYTITWFTEFMWI